MEHMLHLHIEHETDFVCFVNNTVKSLLCRYLQRVHFPFLNDEHNFHDRVKPHPDYYHNIKILRYRVLTKKE